jgi:hypothetical protein
VVLQGAALAKSNEFGEKSALSVAGGKADIALERVSPLITQSGHATYECLLLREDLMRTTAQIVR